MTDSIKKVLVANRGEIALRVMRTCKSMGIKTVAVYSRPDKFAPHVMMADESVFIGEAASAESYLVVDRIIEVARQTGADAIHPGYGFLSENASFSDRCDKEGIVFIGPSKRSIELMGDKTSARKLMEAAGVPLPPGTTTALTSTEEAISTAEKIGYPVLIKAAAGGGGKGMRIVHDQSQIESAVKTARSEANNAFGDDRVYVEKYLEEPRHIEFQILADRHGKTLHLFDRECSIQRRHQKVVEEAPATVLTDELRLEMARAAVTAAASCDYYGAGTIEFLIDKHKNFYFLEMNTRLQVEHPVTEYITGLDLVEWQIRVAQGEKIPFNQEDIKIHGHSIECRVCAEDPAEQFLPSTGRLTEHKIPAGPGVRVDSGVVEGQEITINYDPLLSKLVVHAATRDLAIRKMDDALAEYKISGLQTTIPFCRFVMQHENFQQGRYDTHFIKDYFKSEMLNSRLPEDIEPVILAGVLLEEFSTESVVQTTSVNNINNSQSEWWTKRRH
jgi:acetyl-CoA carboxylase biotin carboxylase subunit